MEFPVIPVTIVVHRLRQDWDCCLNRFDCACAESLHDQPYHFYLYQGVLPTMRRAAKLFVFLLLVGLTILFVVFMRLDAIAEAQITENLSRVLGVGVNVEKLDLKQFASRMNIEGLKIDNPEGYTDPQIAVIKDLDVDFTPLSLLQKTIQVQRLEIKTVDLNFEQQLPNNNFQDILKNIEGQSTSAIHRKRHQRGHQAQFSFKDKNFEIDRVAIRDINVQVHLAPLGKIVPLDFLQKDVQVKIPDIELTNLTPANAGQVLEGTLPKILDEVLSTMLSDIVTESPKQMEPGDPKDALEDILKQLPF
jgi:hypothetical protein